MNLSGNTILITGGTSGIGYALALSFRKLDNVVILLAQNESKLEAAMEQGFHTLRCDLRNQVDIENAVVKIQNDFPQLNMLFNNAGVQHNYSFTDSMIPPEIIIQEIATNLTGQMILTQMLIPILSVQKNSFIINTTSALGAAPKSDALVYSASKSALRNFNTGLRFSLKKTPIKILEIIPPVTDTGMTAGRAEKKIDPRKLVEIILPQLRKEKKMITVPIVRIFLWISFLWPTLAHKLVSK